MGQPGDADAKGPGQILDADRLGIVIVDIRQDLLQDAAAEGFPLHRIRPAHGPAEEIQQIDHQRVIPKTVENIVFTGLILLNLPDPGNETLGIRLAELPGADAPGSAGAEVLIEVNLLTAQDAHDFRREIQVCPLIVMHLIGAGQAVHTERQQDKHLVRLERKKLIVHAHKFPAVQVDIQLIIIMAVILGNLQTVTVLIVRLITLLSTLHRGKRGLNLIGLHKRASGIGCFRKGRLGGRKGVSCNMIRVAIVGTGGISHAHIGAYLQFPDRCKIAALADIIPGKAQRVKEQYGLDAEVFTDYHDLLGMDIDLVDVCTPPFVHAEISINALKSGKNVVCEKPMAASLQECDAMLKARDESGKKLSIIAQNRFREPIRNLKALLDSGIAGPVRHAQINSFWFRGHSYYDLWWRGTWEKEGGGCTLNHAVHHIDMLGWMMGTPKRVTSILANTGHDNAEVEDLSVSVMEYPGALATVTASVVHHGEDQELIFQCEKAKIAAPYSVFASQPQPNGFPLKEPDPAFRKQADDFIASLPPVPWEMHTGQLENVLTALETGGEVAITGEDGRRTIELITAIYKAGAERRSAELPLAADDPFYTVEGIRANVPHFYEKTVSVMEQAGDLSFGADFTQGGKDK